MRLRGNKVDYVLEGICLFILLGMLLSLMLSWSSIPDKIPAHYDLAGNVDRWGSKTELLILPIMSWIMYGFITVLERFPTAWNTGVKVTEENQERVYRTLKYMIKTLKLILVADFAFMSFCSATGRSLPGWFTVVVLVAVFGDLIFWIVRLVQIK